MPMPPLSNENDDDEIASNIEEGNPLNDEQGNDQEMVQDFTTRIQQQMPNLQAMQQFEQQLQQNPALAQTLAKLCPELILAFMQVAQTLQQGGGTAPQPPGQNGGASAPVGPPGSEQDSPPGAPQLQVSGGAGGPPAGPAAMPQGGGAPGPMPTPGATSYGNPPPSQPDPSGLRRQLYTGR